VDIGTRLRRLAVGRASDFHQPVGAFADPERVHGYWIELREKAPDPGWPAWWHPYPGFHRFIATGQWGLGSFDRYLAGDGEPFLDGAIGACEYLLAEQVASGTRRGAWAEPEDYPHTLRVRGPWVSGMAQGLCASLLVRVHGETGREDFAEAARVALLPYAVPASDGGVQALLDGRSFPEEYPTAPPSFVLNGALYAAWGVHDVARGLRDETAQAHWDALSATIADNLWRYDLGHWSRYDLYPHPGFVNIASPSYHELHIHQLRATAMLSPRPEFGETAERFAAYASRRAHRSRAFAEKVAFRLVVPRNHKLAARLPWIPVQPDWEDGQERRESMVARTRS
jgi:hypothetical protein